MKLSDVKNLLTGLRAQRKSIKQSIKEVRDAIATERQALGEISATGVTLEDHVQAHKDFMTKQEEDLRTNIQSWIQGSKVHKARPAQKEVIGLEKYLTRFGSWRVDGGRDPVISWVMVIGADYKRLATMVQEELGKLEGWGTVSQVEKHKTIERHRNHIQELEEALKELQNEQL